MLKRITFTFLVIFVAFAVLYLIMWSPFLFFYLKYQYFSDELNENKYFNSELQAAGLELRYPVDAVTVNCFFDAVGYQFFDCSNLASLSVKLLESGQTRIVAAPSHIPGIVAEEDRKLGDRILLRMEESKLVYDVIDRGFYDEKYPNTFKCTTTSKSMPNIFSIYIVKEICGYKGEFIYQLIGMGSKYGYPYNPTGDSVLPLRVISWIDHSQQKVENGGRQ
jgi:hypothetical protein